MKLYRHVTANSVQLKPLPFMRELSMEAYLIENDAVLALDDGDFAEVQIIDFELPLQEGRESKNTDGRIDLLGLYNNETFAIIELKKAELTHSHCEQLRDYFSQRS